MDNLTLLSVVGSVVTIVCFFITIFSTTYKQNYLSHNKVKVNNSFNLDNSININTSSAINSHNTINNNYTFPSKNTSDYNATENNTYLCFILLVIFGGIIAKFYLSHQTQILSFIGLTVLISMISSLFCINILAKRQLIHKLNLYYNILIWIPLFLLLITFHHPAFQSANLSSIEKILEQDTTKFFIVLKNHPHEIAFLFLQLVGLVFIAIKSILNLCTNIKQTYIGLRHSKIAKQISFKDIGYNIFILIFLYLIISGKAICLYILYIQKMKSLNHKP